MNIRYITESFELIREINNCMLSPSTALVHSRHSVIICVEWEWDIECSIMWFKNCINDNLEERTDTVDETNNYKWGLMQEVQLQLSFKERKIIHVL